MEPTAPTDEPQGNENTLRNATPEDVRRTTQEKEAVFSKTMDEIIESRGEKGQYFAVFGMPASREYQPDGRLLIFTEKVDIGGTSNFVGLTRDGFVAIPADQSLTGGEGLKAGDLIDAQLKKQIDLFYSSTDRSGLNPYPTQTEYNDIPSTRFRNPDGGSAEPNAYLKDSEKPAEPTNRILDFSIRTLMGTIHRSINFSTPDLHEGVNELNDMEVVKQVISSSQEKARSPHEASAIQAKQALEQAQEISSFIHNLPPKA